MLGDASKAKKALGWEAKTSFKKLVHEMMEYDLKQNGHHCKKDLAGNT